ncbi:MAG: nucleoside triphosphate pyrophosphohydrolase [Spirochaetes bacterium GWD1_27_9]|nr:MAG: nucleoside triphosphate pyrophosphohydrolase [Spirochaetes bacterium GWB1_27_13]OHD20110.1 MAG: nucleoside triphosphate pyrophosphohydrolase [Spirochaetes bacterium GWC1_27_15]OHD37904.1 MAG: nucleoside triphosphate pyrophosphohydrolase [Spirochaetes bacterium GWD1_27_9]
MTEFEKLKEIVAKLRSPEGCPWDKEQTHKSLLPYLYEEANEVADTIIRKDTSHLREELGDLLLQIVLHSQIEAENNNFTIEDVIKDLSDKLVRRHPHVFGDEQAENSTEVVKLWEDIKKREKKHTHPSILDKIPYTFSPLLRCYKLQKEASKVGFDWEDYKGPLSKIHEETKELEEAIQNNNIDSIEHEIGDIIFALVNLGKFFGIRSDVALTKVNHRFSQRFKFVEQKVKESGKDFKDFTLDELDKFWDEAKQVLKDNVYYNTD